MIRVNKQVDGVVHLALSGTEAEVRAAVDAFFETYDSYAYNARMKRASYSVVDGQWFLTVSLVRDVTFKSRYRRDYASV